MRRYPIRPALLLALIAFLLLAPASPLYAAGESLSRAAVLSGGGGDTAPAGSLRGAFGEPIAGLVQAPSAATLCSGFLCAPALRPIACTPVTGATINGPTVGVTGVALNYTAAITPSTATGPVLYTWSPAPGSGQNTSAAAFTFAITGTQLISVTAANCGGAAVVEDDLSVTLNAPGAGKPVTGVTISGPITGTTNTDYAFTAAISPSDADTPVTYTWSPAPKSGQGTAAAVYNFPSAGLQNIAVTAQNAGGGNSDQHTITISGPGGPGPLYVPAINVGP